MATQTKILRDDDGDDDADDEDEHETHDDNHVGYDDGLQKVLPMGAQQI